MKKIFKSNDGKEFPTEHECLAHEKKEELKQEGIDNLSKFRQYQMQDAMIQQRAIRIGQSIESMLINARVIAGSKGKVVSDVYQYEYHIEDIFQAFADAEKKAKSIGLSVGSMQRDMPVAVRAGDDAVWKWREEHHNDIDGVILKAVIGNRRIATLFIFNKE